MIRVRARFNEFNKSVFLFIPILWIWNYFNCLIISFISVKIY